jgi:hypothetical protein
MTHDHSFGRLHRADLDREIDTIRIERLLAHQKAPAPGLVDRARLRTGRALIAAGSALAGADGGALPSRMA